MYEQQYQFVAPEEAQVWAEYKDERSNMFPVKHKHPLHFLWSIINLPILVQNFS
jgi:hypothetical protein